MFKNFGYSTACPINIQKDLHAGNTDFVSSDLDLCERM